MKKEIVTVDNLSKDYGGVGLKNVSFKVFREEIVAIIGENGAGKTTLLEILAGIREKDNGDIRIFGLAPDDKEVKNRRSIQLEGMSLPYKLRVKEAFTLFSYLTLRPDNLSELIQKFQLVDMKNKYIKTLSKGEHHRLTIALSLLQNSPLLFLDEPTSGLDPKMRLNLWKILRDEQTRGKTLLFSTHYLEEAEEWADRIILLHKGKILAQGTPKKLIAEIIGFKRKIVFPSSFIFPGDGIGYVLKLPTKWIVYLEKPEEFLGNLPSITDSVIIKETSLEDVFLKLTGEEYVENESNLGD